MGKSLLSGAHAMIRQASESPKVAPSLSVAQCVFCVSDGCFTAALLVVRSLGPAHMRPAWAPNQVSRQERPGGEAATVHWRPEYSLAQAEARTSWLKQRPSSSVQMACGPQFSCWCYSLQDYPPQVSVCCKDAKCSQHRMRGCGHEVWAVWCLLRAARLNRLVLEQPGNTIRRAALLAGGARGLASCTLRKLG